MSLINKMLQDLDARGSHGAAPLQAEIKPVVRAERVLPLPVVIGGVLGVLALTVAGVFGWRWWQQPTAVAVVPHVMAPVANAAPAPLPPVREITNDDVAAAQAAAAPAPMSAPPAQRPVAVVKPRVPRASMPAAPQIVVPEAAPMPTPKPRLPADEAYRRALDNLRDGRTPDAIGELEQALRVNPRHEGARQTLVGLLLEARRSDEAVRLLQAGLALDVRQPSLAMLLARLQIDGGGSGVDTLQRSLAAASGNADYHAFYAGALQRDQRHREAAEHYLAALRMAPDNGVWLMGLGISLLADKRPAQALEAFQRASSSGMLSSELQAFVQRKIGQLAP